MQFDTSLKKRGLYLRRACFRVLLRWSVLAFAPQPHHHSRRHHRRVPRDRRVSIKRRWRQFYAVQFNDLRGRKREASISVWRRKLHPFCYIILYIVRIPMVLDSLKKKKKKKTCAIELELSLKREIFLSGPEEIPRYFCLSLSFCAMGRGVCQAERHVWRCNKNSRCVWLHRTRYINPPPPGGVFRGETCCVRCRIKT